MKTDALTDIVPFSQDKGVFFVLSFSINMALSQERLIH
jgi:hypothetical protein